MNFCEIVKKKKKDEWIVIQGLEVEDDYGYTCGDIVYGGPGGVVIADKISQCYQDFHKLSPVSDVRDDPVCGYLGYKSYSSVTRFTNSMDLWGEEPFGFYGNLSPGAESNQFLTLRCNVFLQMDKLSEPFWAKHVWEKIHKAFLYAEEYDKF